MDFDPMSATGRTMPAQCPEAPRSAKSPMAPPLVTAPPTLSLAPAAGPIAELDQVSSERDVSVMGSRSLDVESRSLDLPQIESYAIAPMSREVSSEREAPHPKMEANSEEERVMLHVLRLVDHIVSPGTLSPVERAFMAGAKVMFEQLSDECEKMLRRSVGPYSRPDHVPAVPPPAKLKTSEKRAVGKAVPTATAKPPVKPAASKTAPTATARKKVKAAKR